MADNRFPTPALKHSPTLHLAWAYSRRQGWSGEGWKVKTVWAMLRAQAYSLPIIPPPPHGPILFTVSRAGTRGKATNSESRAESGKRQTGETHTCTFPLTRPQAMNVGRRVSCAERKKRKAQHTLHVHSCKYTKYLAHQNVLSSSLVFCTHTQNG